MKRLLSVMLVLAVSVPSLGLAAKKDKKKDEEKKPESTMSAGTFKAMKLRNIGPAFNSGRVTDFAVDPNRTQRFFAATASGGLWKTENSGTTWKPIFDGQKSYSIGCLALDPTNSNVLWVGTGENNSQRSVSFGDGVYKTVDGGKSFKNVGLKDSEHIGMIAIDPRDTDVVYVAAQGPLWRSGGERGVYKTTDGGKTWERVLHVSDDTGINEVLLDPRNPDVLYASAYQRSRRVWTLINGGPESGVYKSTDAGANWRKINKGLPGGDKGKIGLAMSPANPDVLYAVVEAQRGQSGTYRTTDRGESWVKRSDYVSGSPQYYNELIPDPVNVDRVYAMDTILHVTEDGGKNFTRMSERNKHVDNHAMWIDPDDTDHILVGCDGGVYESWDRGAAWNFKANLPLSQFYRVSVDTSEPFYYVYGGTQDNSSLGGPSRTLNSSGIANEDWFITTGGDGYETVVDPTNPNILYSESQYAGVVRYDRASGETVDIQPQEEPGEPAHRWNWDTPLFISPHSPTRLYIACQRVFRSDDRGNTWTAISGDLSRQLNRDELPIMGKIWGIDSVAKNMSTSDYGNIVSLTESPLVEGLLFAGTDDGLIQVTEDGGANWRKIDRVPGVPANTYVSRLEASLHDADTVYAAFDNHKMGDFKPYIFVSRDRGLTWESITGDMPEREIVYALIQDHVKPELLFAGTEFGLYFTVDEGKKWIKLSGGFPTIQVRDLDIHRGKNDLAVATFGRGFYILDDYTPLRHVSEQVFEQGPQIFPIADAPWYIEKRSRVSSRGHDFYTAENPPYGATITYYLKEGLKTLKDARKKAEKDAAKEEKDPPLPSMAELRAEEEELAPAVFLTIRDAEGNLVSRVKGSHSKGLHRTTWNLRYPAATPVRSGGSGGSSWGRGPRGPLVSPGTFTVTIDKQVNGVFTALAGPKEFQVVALDIATLPAASRADAAAFQAKVQRLRRAVRGAGQVLGEQDTRISSLRKALLDTREADVALMEQLEGLQARLYDLRIEFFGDRTKSRRNVTQPPAIQRRVDSVAYDQYDTTAAPTTTQQNAYGWAADAFETALAELRKLEDDLQALENEAEAAGAPITPGRFPEWTRE